MIVELLAILLLFPKISNLYTIPCGFYGSPNAQNWMCELYAHISNLVTYPDYVSLSN